MAHELIIHRRPFALGAGPGGTTVEVVPEGQTLAEMVAGAGIDPVYRDLIVVAIADQVIYRDYWHRVWPRAGMVITIAVQAGGGGGGEGQKSPLRTVLSLAVVALAAVAAPYLAPIIGGGLGLGTAVPLALIEGVVGAAITFVGNVLVNAIAPPPSASLSRGAATGGDADPRRPAITGASNRAIPYGAVPAVYGRVRMYPVHAAQPYTLEIDGKIVAFLLLDFGYGHVDVSDITIGSSPIESFGADISYWVRPEYQTGDPLSVYTRDVDPQPTQQPLTAAGGVVQVSTADDADSFVLDIAFAGLARIATTEDGSGTERQEASVVFTVAARPAGTGDSWTLLGETTITDATYQQVVRSIERTLPARGKWEIQVSRLTADSTDDSVRDASTLVAVKTFTNRPPTAFRQPHTLLEMRINSSDALTGSIDQISALAYRRLPVWHAESSSWIAEPTRNPAWIAWDILTGPANPRPLASSRLNRPAFEVLAAVCDAEAANDPGQGQYLCDGVFEGGETVRDLLRVVLGIAHATLGTVDGLWTPLIDGPQDAEAPVQLITARNSSGYSEEMSFPAAPHGLRCKFAWEDKGYLDAEVVAFDDGYDGDTATEYETIDLRWISRREQAWRAGRRALAEGRLRRWVVSVTMAVEYIRCTRLDLVAFAHDVPRSGGTPARVKSRVTSGGNTVSYTLDEPVVMEEGLGYVIRGRQAQGVVGTQTLATVAGESTVVTLAVPSATASGFDVGDLVVVGVAETVTRSMVVKAIVPAADGAAKVVLVDEAPAIQTADTSPIPTAGAVVVADPRTAPPAPVTGLAVRERLDLIGNVWSVSALAVSWQPAAGSYPAAYEVYLGTGASRRLHGITRSPSYDLVGPFPVGASRTVTVVAVAGGGAKLPPDAGAAVTYQVVGDKTPPADIDRLLIDVAADGSQRLHWEIAAAVPDLAGVLFRWSHGESDNWGAMAEMNRDPVRSPPFVTSVLSGGTKTLLARVVDTAGNVSLGTARAVLNIGERGPSNLVETFDLTDWSGTISGGAVDAGVVWADDTSDPFWVDGADVWWVDDAAPFWGPQNGPFWAAASQRYWGEESAAFWPAVVFPQLVYQDAITPTAAGLMSIAVTLDGPGRLQVRTVGGLMWPHDSDLFWPATDSQLFWAWGPWVDWRGVAEVTVEEYQLRVIIGSGPIQGALRDLVATVDAPDVEEILEDVVIAAGGTVLPITKSYRAIRYVRLTLQDDGGAGVTARVASKAVSGPVVQVLNSSGAAVTGLIDAEIRGY